MVLAKPTPCSHDSNHIEIETGRAENTKRPDILAISGDVWRRGWESNPRIKVLQTSPLPLGYRALLSKVALTAKNVHGGEDMRDRRLVRCQINEDSRISSMLVPDSAPKASLYRICVASLLVLSTMLIVGCESKREVPASSPASQTNTGGDPAKAFPEVHTAIPESWLGKWDGPEGTFLQVSKTNDKYQITIQNLDGPRTFDATPVDGKLQFVRDGQSESIHAGNGEDAGMKWLLDKKNCLVVRKGEGFCRE